MGGEAAQHALPLLAPGEGEYPVLDPGQPSPGVGGVQVVGVRAAGDGHAEAAVPQPGDLLDVHAILYVDGHEAAGIDRADAADDADGPEAVGVQRGAGLLLLLHQQRDALARHGLLSGQLPVGAGLQPQLRAGQGDDIVQRHDGHARTSSWGRRVEYH